MAIPLKIVKACNNRKNNSSNFCEVEVEVGFVKLFSCCLAGYRTPGTSFNTWSSHRRDSRVYLAGRQIVKQPHFTNNTNPSAKPET